MKILIDFVRRVVAFPLLCFAVILQIENTYLQLFCFALLSLISILLFVSFFTSNNDKKI